MKQQQQPKQPAPKHPRPDDTKGHPQPRHSIKDVRPPEQRPEDDRIPGRERDEEKVSDGRN